MIVERLAGGFGRWMLALQLSQRDGVCLLRVCVCARVCALSTPVAHSNQRGKKNAGKEISSCFSSLQEDVSELCVYVGWWWCKGEGADWLNKQKNPT